jgi:A/G-specific adenine glycosylase
VSEIMLQQTRVGSVIAYFERFVARFPDASTLARASLDEVLALWSGLGYYARARNLHRAAGIVVERHAGELPAEIGALTQLPGIGRSTAAAILALSAGAPQAILDGNVKRVLARFHAIEGWPGASQVVRELWSLAEAHTPATDVAAYTQAVMDLGATVCTRGKPRCEACPVGDECAARLRGIEADLPTPRPPAERPSRQVTVLVVRKRSGETLLERRPPSGIWGGLLSFPELGADDDAGQWCRRHLGVEPSSRRRLAVVEHAFTHFDLTLAPLELTLGSEIASVMDGANWLWYNSAEPLPGGVAAPIGRILREVTRTESIH